MSTTTLAISRADEWYERLHSHGLGPRWSGNGEISSRCPAHNDQNPSLSSTIKDDGRILLHCHAGSEACDVVEALGVDLSYLRPTEHGLEVPSPSSDAETRPPAALPSEDELTEAQTRLHGSDTLRNLGETRGWKLLTVLAYQLGLDEDGRVLIPFRDRDGNLLTVERYDPASTNGSKTLATKGVRRQLLLPPGGISGTEVVFTEGASDAFAAHSRGLADVVAVPSASTWRADFTAAIEAAGVKQALIAFDTDEPGRKHAQRVAKSLAGRGILARIVDLDPARSDGYDVTDYLLEHPHESADQLLRRLADLATPYVTHPELPEAHAAADSFDLVELSETEAKPTRWAWGHWILLGMFNLLVGPEGSGKGTLLAWMIAKWTLGELPGDLYGAPARVLIIGDEDDTHRIWIPRLKAAGADLSMVRQLRGAGGTTVTLPSGVDRLRDLHSQFPYEAVVCDQFLDQLDPGLNPDAAKDVRRASMAARALAAELDVAFIATLHTNKSRGGSFRQSVSGSHQFNAVSKSSILVAPHPDGPEERRVVSRGKGNYSQRPVSQEFTIKGRSPKIGDHVVQTTVAADFGDCALTADDLLAPPKSAPTSKAAQARQYLESVLGDHEGHDAGPIIEHLEDEFGLDRRAARKVRDQVGAVSTPKAGFQGGATWRLPHPHELFTRENAS